jgi:hypothetical protein
MEQPVILSAVRTPIGQIHGRAFAAHRDRAGRARGGDQLPGVPETFQSINQFVNHLVDDVLPVIADRVANEEAAG